MHDPSGGAVPAGLGSVCQGSLSYIPLSHATEKQTQLIRPWIRVYVESMVLIDLVNNDSAIRRCRCKPTCAHPTRWHTSTMQPHIDPRSHSNDCNFAARLASGGHSRRNSYVGCARAGVSCMIQADPVINTPSHTL